MAIAKPENGNIWSRATKLLDKIIKEKTGKEAKNVKRELLSEVVMSLIPGGGAATAPLRIGRQEAVRGITRGFLKHLAPRVGRKAALKAAKPHVSATARLPQEMLNLVEEIEVKRLPRDIRARLLEFATKADFEVAQTAKKGVPAGLVKRREIYLDPSKAQPTSVYHEIGHLMQRTTGDPALKKLLKPVTREYTQRTAATSQQSLTERHARDFASDMLKRLQWERTGKRFSAKELDEVASWSLENVLRKSGWVP